MTILFSRLQTGLVAFLLVIGCCHPALAEDDAGFSITRAETVLKQGVYRLDARIHFVLPHRVIEAMENGVPQVIEIEMQVLRPRKYLWDEALASVVQRYEIVYHALSERYVVNNLNTASRNSYPSLGETLYQIGMVKDFPLIDAKLLPGNETCYGAMRARLDIESLPTPIRLTAYTNASWWLSSDWIRWPLQP